MIVPILSDGVTIVYVGCTHVFSGTFLLAAKFSMSGTICMHSDNVW